MHWTDLFLDLYPRGPEDDLKRVETCSPKYVCLYYIYVRVGDPTMHWTDLFLDLYPKGPEDDLKRVETCSPKYVCLYCLVSKSVS
jgi:hypothetical protein